MKTKSCMKKVFALLTIILCAVLNGIAQPYPQPLTPPGKLDPTVTKIPQFVDPMPHFAPGLRVNAKAGGDLLIKAVPNQQVALSTGTHLPNGKTIGVDPGAGLGDYLTYQIFQNGKAVSLPLWPSFTIEAAYGKELKVQYENDLFGLTYPDFNVWTPDPDQTKTRNFNLWGDQTLMSNGYTLNGDPYMNAYQGPIPMVTHLHGGEIPSNSDGGPMAWFMPGLSLKGPAFANDASTLCTYPNLQESPTVWYHPHDQGLTRINVYLGMAGYYFIRQPGENLLRLPGWALDDKVLEIQPGPTSDGYNRTPPFPDVLKSVGLGTQTYLPEVELAIQDRQFNENGGLYWPAGAPDGAPNPDIHPLWIPEFTGDIMTVNGKSWPYLSVAPRKYMFRMLDGCNSRFLNLWLSSDPSTGVKDGPAITVLSTEGGFLDTPVTLDPKKGQTLFLGPAERPMVVIDFSTVPAGSTWTLMNDKETVDGPVVPGLDDRIMQFVVNGKMVSLLSPRLAGKDKSVIPMNLRPGNPLVKLTDFNGGIAPGVKIAVKRQLLLNEITAEGGPAMVAVNNSHFDEVTPLEGAVTDFGAPTEFAREGTTELWQIINTTADSHPMHPHLVQWQIVSRQAFDAQGYMNNTWVKAWDGKGVPNYPDPPVKSDYDPYPGGAGSPNDYNKANDAGFIGGNPDVTPYLIPGTLTLPQPEERGWKDAIKSFSGEVLTVLVRIAPTTLPINTPSDRLIYSFDPSTGPGYVWHCHIIDHEDMDMMRPFMVKYAPIRNIPVVNCAKSAIKKADDPKNSFYTVKGTEFDATVTLPKGMNTLKSLSYSLSGATSGTGTKLDGVQLNTGINIITWTATNDDDRSDKCVTSVIVIGSKDCNVDVPNGFSPNADNINDLFVITCLDDYPNAKLSIYNRSNKLVYQKDHYGNLAYWPSESIAWWDGKSNQGGSTANLPTGTYIYILNLGDGKLTSIKIGTVFLSR
jgi:spore coat protein A, manganese oxidase